MLQYTQPWDASWLIVSNYIDSYYVYTIERQLFAQSNSPYLCMWHGKSKINLDFAITGQRQLASILNMGNISQGKEAENFCN